MPRTRSSIVTRTFPLYARSRTFETWSTCALFVQRHVLVLVHVHVQRYVQPLGYVYTVAGKTAWAPAHMVAITYSVPSIWSRKAR